MTAPGRVVGVNGPLVHVEGLGAAARFELAEVGERALPGEVVSLSGTVAAVQVYEHTGGLRVGEPAHALGLPLSAWLGPGLLGGVFDGLLRPLDAAGDLLGDRRISAPEPGLVRFRPVTTPGALVAEGDLVGVADGVHDFEHRVVVPPGVRGRVTWAAAEGSLAGDALVAELDTGVPIRLRTTWPVRLPRPVLERLPGAEPFVTGQRAVDLLVPIGKGSSASVVGGFGEGKTMLLEQIAKWGAADVIVYVGCGERGNELADVIDEMRELDDPRTGRPLMERTVLIANTSNMPVMAREASIHTAVTVGEHFRDMGYDVVVIADSTSRWAEAQREFSSRTGALPAEEGYPADLPAALAAFYQRAGRVTTLGGREGSVTIVTSVSPPGGDLTEPVSAHTQRFVQDLWVLDRRLAYARHYPAVSWRGSFSRDADAIARWQADHGDDDWGVRRARLVALLSEADRISSMAELVGQAGLPAHERMVLLGGRLVREALLQQSALSANDAFCTPAKQTALCRAVLAVHDATLELVDRQVAASEVESVDLGPLLRAKDSCGPDDAAAVEQVVAAVLRTLEGLA